MTKTSDSTTKTSPAKATSSPPKSPNKAPNKITSQIDSPDSKAAKVKSNTTFVRIAQTKFMGISIVSTAKLTDREDDGFNYPIHKSIITGEPWAVNNCFFFSGDVRISLLNDSPAYNTGTPYRRRCFIRLDSSATSFPTDEELKTTLETVCTVSILNLFSILF